MKKLLFLLVAIISTMPVWSQGIDFEAEGLEQALARAADENKFVMVEAFTKSCGWCKWMDKNVFNDERTGNFYNKHFVNYKLDMDSDAGKELGADLGISGYPSFVVYSSEGDIVKIAAGAMESPDFIMFGEKAMQVPASEYFGTLQNKYKRGIKSKEMMYNYTVALLDYNAKSSTDVFEEYHEMLKGKEYYTAKNWALYNEAVNDYESELYGLIKGNREKFYKVADKAEVEQLLLKVELRHRQKTEDWKRYVEIASVLVGEYEYFNSDGLNSIAWTAYENIDNEEMLTRAMEWAHQSVKIDENYYNLDTEAHLAYKLGKMDVAKKSAEKAIALAKEMEMDYEITQDLLNNIEKQ